jgi:hypothetical protein
MARLQRHWEKKMLEYKGYEIRAELSTSEIWSLDVDGNLEYYEDTSGVDVITYYVESDLSGYLYSADTLAELKAQIDEDKP